MKITLRLLGSITLLTLLGVASHSNADVRSGKAVSEAADRSTVKIQSATLPAATPIPVKRQQAAAGALTGMTMTWSVSPGGGFAGGNSAQYGLSAAAGQPVVGEGASADFGLAVGFYHGAETCNCDNTGDIDVDGTYNSVDLNLMIYALFLNGPNPQDQTCPTFRSDMNCDNASNTVDLNLLIQFLFFNGPPPLDCCTE